MKRVVCLLLCAVLLMGLLPAAALADGAKQLYFEECSADGTPYGNGRVDGMDVSYGATVYFRAYTAQTDGEAVTDEQLRLYENNRDVTENALRWASSGTDGFYVWNTKTAKANMPVFLAEIDGVEYNFSPYIHDADVGWFSSPNKSLSTALAYGNEPDANVYYNGSEDVTVYLTSEFSFVTYISEDSIQKDDGIEYELIDRGTSDEGVNFGAWLEVTCPEGLTGEQKLSVTVKRGPWWALDELSTVTYTVTFSETGVPVEDPSDGFPGEPVLLPGVAMDGRQLYLGIGRIDAGNVTLAGSGSFTAPKAEEHQEVFQPFLWSKGREGYVRIGTEHYNEDEITGWDQISELKLYAPVSEDNNSEPNWILYEDGCGIFTVDSEMEGTWKITASCMLGGKKYEASCYVTRTNAYERTIEAGDVNTVEKLNKLFEEIAQKGFAEPRWYTVNLAAGTYDGTIVIPKETGSGRLIVILKGSSEEGGTTICGGIQSDNDTLSIQNVRFTGAGAEQETWPDGTPNYALYGAGRANSVRCTFEDYDRAVVWTEGRRMFGIDNVYTNNHIAWYVDFQYSSGGNTDATGTTFEDNFCAIYIKSLGDTRYTNEITDVIRFNRFIGNTTDVHNLTGRWWFIPANYFNHTVLGITTEIPSVIGTVFCYPRAERLENGTVRYLHGQIDENGDTISNLLTGTYQTPESELSGKIFKVADEQDDSILATFTFADQAEQQSAARRSIALFSAEEEKSFDATVRVDRTDEQKIDFTMNDPCRSVTVKLPCDFKYGTVTHTLNGESEQLETVRFDGKTVSFETSEGGDYIIEYKLDGYLFAAGYDKDGRLVGVKLVSGMDDPVTIDGAVTIKYFIVDLSYRPLTEAEIVIPTK